MRATVMYAAGDVRVENVPDAAIVEPTDAVVRVTRACICGSDLDGVPDGYRATNDREAIKVMVTP
jgi:threonine dehydrogenase-like Zn-dependent dehydrogenase